MLGGRLERCHLGTGAEPGKRMMIDVRMSIARVMQQSRAE
jgi:hypothetical protein